MFTGQDYGSTGPIKVSGCTDQPIWHDPKEVRQVEADRGSVSPPDKRVNDGIQGDACSLTYMTVADAVDVIAEGGQGTLLAKLDIKSA